MSDTRTRPTVAEWLAESYSRRHDPVRPDTVEEVQARLAASKPAPIDGDRRVAP